MRPKYCKAQPPKYIQVIPASFAWLQVLRINDKDYSITFATYFNVEWFEHRLKVVEELQVSVAQTYLLQKSKS